MLRKIIVAIWLAVLASSCETNKPNTVLLITVDSLGASDTNTPNISKLKKDGMSFTLAYTPSPVTLPAITSVMTGLHPLGHGVLADEGYELGGEAITLAEAFQENRFRTSAVIGSSVLSPTTGIEQGFDSYIFPFKSLPVGFLPEVGTRSADEVVDDAAGWIAAFGDKPFFIWTHFGDLEAKGANREEALKKIDDAVGKLIAQMPQGGRNTVIILTSTAGDGQGFHEESGHGIFLYDATTRIPLIFAGPGVKAGESKAQTTLVDVSPTIISFMQFALPEGMQGAAMWGLLRGETAVEIRPEWVTLTYAPYQLWGWSPLAGLRQGSWKYIRAPKPELYNLDADPKEERNVIALDPETASKLEERLKILEREMKLKTSPGKKTTPLPDPEGNLVDPKDVVKVLAILKEAENALDAKDFKKAVELLTAVRESDPQNRRAPFMLAQAYDGLGEGEKAIEMLEEASQRNPGDSVILATLGDAYMHAGMNDMAVKSFEAALAIEPKMIPVYLSLGYVYPKISEGLSGEARIQQLQKGLAYLIGAMKLGDEDAHTFFNIGLVSLQIRDEMVALEQGNPPKTESPKSGPTSEQFLKNAVTGFELALEKDPNLPEAHFMLGQILSHDPKLKDEAKVHLNKFLELAPGDPKAKAAKTLLEKLGN